MLKTLDDDQKNELKAVFIFGLVIALTIDAIWLFVIFPQMGRNPWRWPIALLTVIVQTLITIFGLVLAARLHREIKVSVWFALPYGALAGAVVGAVSIGLSIGFRILLGMRSGMIEMMGEAAYLNSASLWLQFREGLVGGVVFGAYGGFIPGALGSLALSLWRHFRNKRGLQTTNQTQAIHD